jgi:very-short-patch-repair endonuclease
MKNLKAFDYADFLNQHLRALKLPAAVREYRPFPDRRFRLDLAWPDRLLFVECDGGEHIIGRHNRAAGMASDCEKLALLTLDGWRGFRFLGSQVTSGFAVQMLERWFQRYP